MTQPIKNIHDTKGLPLSPEGGSDRFGATVAPMGREIGLTGLGCMYTQVEPGKRAFPYHNHLGADEMFVILEGTGTYRFGEREYPIKPGDVCGAPKGGPEVAHQIINTGTVTLKYLGISTMVDPEVVQYPDSGKFAAIATRGQEFMSAHLKVIGREGESLDYWDGEDV